MQSIWCMEKNAQGTPPPLIFEGVLLSMIPTPPPKPRPTTSTSLEIRGKQDDELDAFLKMDNVTFECLSANISTVICYSMENTLHVQSTSFFAESLPMFLVKISEGLKFQTYHAGVRCYKNHITTLNSWSKLEETIRFLHTLPIENKKAILKEEFEVMASPTHKIYNQETIIRALEYFALSRSLYNRLRIDLKLPSVKTLTKLTSKVGKLDDDEFITKTFSNVNDKQRNCAVLVDEIYVKPLLQYHGRNVFGKTANNPESLATTVLGIG